LSIIYFLYKLLNIKILGGVFMKIALGSDHAGLPLKNEILKYLKSKTLEVGDFGTYTESSCDYPDFAMQVAEKVATKEYEFGILVCGTGIGISIAANKVPGIRAALCSDTFSAHASREHNNANILALGQRVVGVGLALDIVDTFLNAKFEGDRHQRRIDKISAIETKYSK
jgi:ribose 5-phosphate isomerase B